MATKQRIFIPNYISSVDYQPARVQPRILFYNGLKECEPYFIASGSALEREFDAFPYFDNYSGQVTDSGSLSLLFFNEEAPYGVAPTGSLYTQYWEDYVELLYNPRTRLLNASAIIPLADYFKMELNDIVEFRGNYYHLRYINDYNLKNGECQVQLLGPILAAASPASQPICDYDGVTVICEAPPTTTSTSTTSTSTTTTTTLPPCPLNIEYLIVAGGGGGGNSGGSPIAGGGGGGAGGLLSSSLALQGGTYSVIVGGGGGPQGSGAPSSISNILIGTIQASGGGAGATGNGGSPQGANGGSGGGGAACGAGVCINPGQGISGQGFRGGSGVNYSSGCGAGGGGAAAAGGDAVAGNTPTTARAGGNGRQSAIDGTLRFYAGGGGGGGNSQSFPPQFGGNGGSGGGGKGGGTSSRCGAAVAGTPNTGGGGGGACRNSGEGAGGGSGVVIIRYAGTPKATGGTITQVDGFTIHKFTSNGNFVYNCSIPPESPYAIGQFRDGGYVFYVTGSFPSQSGLIAAPIEGIIDTPWGCSGTDIGEANYRGIGYGQGNTTSILNACAIRPIAASEADNYTFGGYTDWYLPTRDEMFLFGQQYFSGSNVGPMATEPNRYWTSTQASGSYRQFTPPGNPVTQAFQLLVNPIGSTPNFQVFVLPIDKNYSGIGPSDNVWVKPVRSFGPAIPTTTTTSTTTTTTTLAPLTIDYLIVAGGGAGGRGNGGVPNARGGGGGAGGFITGSRSVNPGTSLNAVVGAGGVNPPLGNGQGVSGTNSSFNSLTAVAGGGGGGTTPQNGLNGGSGGGAHGTTGVPGNGIDFQGNRGGFAGSGMGGNGGGAAEIGGTGTGGAGLMWLDGVVYAAGGRGGNGFSGGLGTTPGCGGQGTANAETDGTPGINGVVIVRYTGTPRATGGTITQSGGFTYHTFTSNGTFTRTS